IHRDERGDQWAVVSGDPTVLDVPPHRIHAVLGSVPKHVAGEEDGFGRTSSLLGAGLETLGVPSSQIRTLRSPTADQFMASTLASIEAANPGRCGVWSCPRSRRQVVQTVRL